MAERVPYFARGRLRPSPRAANRASASLSAREMCGDARFKRLEPLRERPAVLERVLRRFEHVSRHAVLHLAILQEGAAEQARCRADIGTEADTVRSGLAEASRDAWRRPALA